MEKRVSKLGLLTMSIGGMIGWGAFMQPGIKFLPVGGVLNTMIGMFIGLIMVSVIASCYGIILNKSPESAGGEYSYSKKAFSVKNSFIVGWFLLFVFIGITALNVTSFSLIFRNVLFPDVDFITLYTIAGSPVTLGEVLLSVVVVILFSQSMLKGVSWVVKVQNVVTVALIIIVVSIFALTLVNIDYETSPLVGYFSQGSFDLRSIIAILVITPWAYYGVSNIPKVASDAKIPYKQVIKITILSLVCGFLIYQILLFVTATYFSQNDLINYRGWATGDAISNIFGPKGLIFMTLGLTFAIFSSINSFYIGAVRVMQSMSEDALLPAKFALKHTKHGTPHNSIYFILLVVIISPFFGRQVLGWIVGMAAFGGALVFLYTSLTAYKISQGLEKTIGLLATIFSVIFIALLIFPLSPGFLSFQSIAVLIIWSLAGVYLYKTNNKRLIVALEN